MGSSPHHGDDVTRGCDGLFFVVGVQRQGPSSALPQIDGVKTHERHLELIGFAGRSDVRFQRPRPCEASPALGEDLDRQAALRLVPHGGTELANFVMQL